MESELQQAIRLLKVDHHILSKNYHDGAGRQYWLRDKNQKTVLILNKQQVEEIKKEVPMTKSTAVSSDEAYILATETGHKAWN